MSYSSRMGPSLFRCVVVVVLAMVPGCPAGSFALDETVPCEVADGGVPDGSIVDAGFCDSEGVGIDRGLDGGENENPADAEQACAALRLSTCGQSNECERDPGCVAADLVARFEPERCAESAGDARSFPACALGNCTVLASRVCGVGSPGACEDAPGCDPARELARRADSGDVSADTSCAQALADEALFPSCQ